MAKKTREIEIEYPDCTICGSEIPAGGNYFDLRINLGKMTVGESGGSSGVQTGNSQRPFIICKKCSTLTGSAALSNPVQQKIMSEVDKQKQELEK